MTVAGTVGGVAVKGLVALVKGRFADHRAELMIRQLQELVDEIAREGSHAEEILSRVDLETSDLLHQYFVNLLNTPGRLTSSVSARMTAHYLHEKKSADRFFRRFGMLLKEIIDSELVLLQELVEKILTLRGEALAMELHLSGEKPNTSAHPFPRLYGVLYFSDGEEKYDLRFPGSEEHFTVFRLLKQHGFAQELPGGGLGNGHPLGLLVREPHWPHLSMMLKLTRR